MQPLALLERGMLQPLELLEWEPPQIHEQELLQLLVPRWCRAVGVMVAWVADSLRDAAVISSAECVSQVAQRCVSS